MLDVGTSKRLACHEDFVESAEEWKDSNLVPRVSNPMSSVDLPSGSALKSENGGDNVEKALLETDRRINAYSTESGKGMPSNMAVKPWSVDTFPYRNLGGNVLTVDMYTPQKVTLDGFHNGKVVLYGWGNPRPLSNGDSGAMVIASGCTADIVVKSMRFHATGNCTDVVSISNCHRVNLEGCLFTRESGDAAVRNAVVCDGSTVVLKDCSVGTYVPVKTSASGSVDKNSILVEEANSMLSALGARVSSVSSRVDQLTKGILASGTTDGVSYVLYNDRANGYRGTLMMWRHGVAPSIKQEYDNVATPGTWSDSRNVMELYDLQLPYSYANTLYGTFVSVGNPIVLEGSDAMPLMAQDETTGIYDFVEKADVWSVDDHSTLNAMLMSVTLVSDFKRQRNGAGLTDDRTQKFANRFLAYSVHKFPKKISGGTGFDPGKKITRKTSASGSWVQHDYAYQYTENGGYAMDFITIGEISEESYNQLVTE